MRDIQIKILFTFLVVLAAVLVFAKVHYLGLPLKPAQESVVWTVEAHVKFNSTGKSTMVSFDIPDQLDHYLQLDELFVSRKYGMKIESSNGDRRIEWSTRRAKGEQHLYYRIEVVDEEGEVNTGLQKAGRQPKTPKVPAYEEPMASAVADVLDQVRGKSSNIFTFVSQLLVRLNAKTPDENVMLIRKDILPGTEEWVEQIRYVLAGARITTRVVRGVILDEKKVKQELVPWLEAYNGERWEGFNPLTGSRGFPDNFLRWSTGSEPVLFVEGGRNASVEFAASKRFKPVVEVAGQRAEATKSPLAAWSLFHLPLNTQDVYRILLMVPLGALVVVIMRTIVGVPTFGTFMPILIALAFRETDLSWGIILFCLIVSIGLTLRFYMERLQLLLVPRLSAVLLLVILLMLAISLVSNHLGFDKGFSVALFPIVILTMTIERMSVVWEESGPTDAFKEGLGSLLVATLGFLVMNNNYLQYLIFIFPELLLIVFAVFLLMGRYTGYRLNELLRFRDLIKEVDNDAGKGPKTS